MTVLLRPAAASILKNDMFKYGMSDIVTVQDDRGADDSLTAGLKPVDATVT